MEEKKEIQQEETTTIDPEEKRKETHILTQKLRLLLKEMVPVK